jgi:hypothetical protein
MNDIESELKKQKLYTCDDSSLASLSNEEVLSRFKNNRDSYNRFI